MILSGDEIRREVDAGRIKIDPYDPELVGTASVDLTVSRWFRRLSQHGGPIDVLPEVDYRDYSEVIEVPAGGFLEVAPKETVLGLTRENIGVPEDMCGWFEGRSR